MEPRYYPWVYEAPTRKVSEIRLAQVLIQVSRQNYLVKQLILLEEAVPVRVTSEKIISPARAKS